MSAGVAPGAPTGRVIVVGSVNVDLVVAADHLPVPGETVTGGRFEQHQGGKGGNQAVAAARLGARVAFVGAVGDDAFGTAARVALEAEGVDVTALATVAGTATGVALITVDRAGENAITVAGGANTTLDSVRVRTALRRLEVGPGDVVVVGHEIRTGAAHEALRAGRLAGATTILNPAPAGGLGPSTLALADVLTPNRGELTALAGAGAASSARGSGRAGVRPATGARAAGRPEAPAAMARRLLRATADATRLADQPRSSDRRRRPARSTGRVPRAILVSLGADGAVLVVGPRATTIRALPVDVVDTVGAGDTLNGALAAGIAMGLALPDAAARAVVASGLAVTVAGARDGMPTSAAVDAAMRGRRG